MKRFVVYEKTEDLVDSEGLTSVTLRDREGEPIEYFIYKKDIPKLIEGLKLFIEE